ncbi:unnamed protein product [Clavelina lepadiformis]|uniref:CUB domain-containing protein n=1 Tax=Clavelina lepadiformis TaxID=159417 RepID=A0ABP0FMH4_CLALP
MQMTNSWTIIFLLASYYYVSTDGSRSKLWFNNRNGGVFSSPNYPFQYPTNFKQRYVINAPSDDYVVVLEFLDFLLDFSDYLKVFNGRKKHDKVGKKYTGGQAPRRFVSSTRRVRMLFVTDHVAELRGFQIKYNFVDTRNRCAVSTLQLPHVMDTSCLDESFGFATNCTIRCENGYEPQGGATARCVDGSFTSVTCQQIVPSYCELTDEELRGSRIIPCGEGSQQGGCMVRCTDNYLSDVTGCVVEDTKPTCSLRNDVIVECERNNMTDCPYTIEEIIDFYDGNRLQDDVTLTHSQQIREEVWLDNLPDPTVRLGNAAGGLRCFAEYCAKNTVPAPPYPYDCGRCKGPRLRKACVFCRYVTQCNRPPPSYLAG